MNISSSAFENQGKVPAKFTCMGENVSPPLRFENVPTDAKRLVLIVDDPDAVSGNWAHWVVYNIDPTVVDVTEGGMPRGGVQGVSSFGKAEYGGPCPPNGEHRYFFKLYALDIVLSLNSPDKALVEKAMQGHVLEQAELVGLFQK